MNLLLTGASGFVGKNFIKAFSGKHRIFAIVRNTSDTKDIEGLCEIYRYDGDIMKLKDCLNVFCKNCRAMGGGFSK